MKGLKVAVVVMGVMILFGVVALVVVIIDRIGGGLEAGAPADVPVVAADNGHRVGAVGGGVAITVDDGRAYIVRRRGDGVDRLIVIEVETGDVLRRLTLPAD